MPVFNNILAGAAGSAGGAAADHTIERSLRFNRDDGAYLNRTFGAGGNRKTWTWSGWVKLGREQTGGSSNRVTLFECTANFGASGNPYALLNIVSGFLGFGEASGGAYTTAQFRDHSAWYHVVAAVDTTQSTPANRLKLYVNGVQYAHTGYTLGHNSNTAINQAGIQHNIGREENSDIFLADYLLAEVYFIDGKQMAASDFGELDDKGVWQPKAYTGGYDVAGGTTITAATGAEPILNTSDDYGKTVSSGVRSDSNSSNIVLALPLNGSNGGTTITDYHHTIKGSGSAKTVSIYTGSTSGGAVTSTAESNYYGSSFYTVRGPTNNYTASDYIYRTGDSDLAFGTGSFCVEFWYKPGTFVQNSTMFDSRHNSTDWPNATHGFQFYTNHNGDLIFRTGSSNIITASSKLTSGEWAHLAVTGDYSGSSRTIRIYCNGTLAGSATSNNDFSEGRFHLGSAANNGEGSNGYYSDLRIYKGVAKYTSNFTVPDKPDGGVNQFHLKFADTSSNAALGTDSSGSNNTWTVNNLNAADVNGGAPTVTGSNIFPAEGTAIANLWDGQTSSYPGDFLTAANGGIITVSWPTPLTNVTKIQYYSYNGNDRHEINNGGMSSNSGSGGGWKTAYDSSTPIALTSLALQKADGNSYVKIGGIKVNDVHLTTSNYSSPTSPSDSLLDSPSNYDDGTNIGGNYCTLNPLDNQQGNGTLSNGNLDITQNTTQWAFYRSTMFVSSGKWYWECTIGNNQYSTVGICTDAWSMGSATNAWANESNSMYGYYPYNGEKYNGDSGVSYATADTSAAGSVIGVALDMDNGTLEFYKDGTSLGTAYTGLTGKNVSPTHWLYNQSNADSYNFGQRSFKYAPGTSGGPAATFKALCTQNFDDPTITKPSEHFDVVTYDGTGQAQAITGLDFQPDIAWIKERNHTSWHRIIDSVRGQKELFPNDDNTEVTFSQGVNSFTSGGFNLGTGSDSNVNTNTKTYVGWLWKAATSFSNSAGANGATMASSGKVNQAAGISIVTYSYTGTGQYSYVHGLNKKPDLVIRKARNLTEPWSVYHSAMGFDERSNLDNTNASSGTTTFRSDQGDPTSTLNYINNNNTSNVLEYVFTAVPGFSAFGRYEGTGDASGDFQYCGFTPRWILLKNVDNGSNRNWIIIDTKRTTFNSTSSGEIVLFANQSDTESYASDSYGRFDYKDAVDILSNGFRLKEPNTSGVWTQINNTQQTHIWAAFADIPFKYARAF